MIPYSHTGDFFSSISSLKNNRINGTLNIGTSYSSQQATTADWFTEHLRWCLYSKSWLQYSNCACYTLFSSLHIFLIMLATHYVKREEQMLTAESLSSLTTHTVILNPGRKLYARPPFVHQNKFLARSANVHIPTQEHWFSVLLPSPLETRVFIILLNRNWWLPFSLVAFRWIQFLWVIQQKI